MQKLLNHQQRFASNYTGKNLLNHEGGTGKTFCACAYIADGRDEDALVICPKRVVKKWEKTIKDFNTKATVVSKNDFKKLKPKKWSAIICDEIDEFASPLFTKGRSQLSEILYNQVKMYPDVPFLGLSATMIRSTPWNLHTILALSGHYIDWKQWRNEFFSLEKRPYMPYPGWLPKKGWQQMMPSLLQKYTDIVLLKDCVGELPPATEIDINVTSDKFELNPEWEPKAAFIAEHRHEQKNKIKKILEIGKEYKKVLVVGYFVEQIEELQKQLSKDRLTFSVHGGTKNQEDILKEANEAEEAFLCVQASLGAGFDADSFSCVIFTSMAYSVRDWVQMKFRVRRIHNLHPVVYYYLLGGRCDKSILKQVRLGKDFTPSEW